MLSKHWVKICGITRRTDAEAAVAAGADAIGLVFYEPSPRAVDAGQAADIVEGLPSGLEIFGLFVNPAPVEVEAIIEKGIVNRLQFHGEESEDFCESFGVPYMKAVRLRSKERVAPEITDYKSARYVLLDSYSEKAPGGTGIVSDWDTASTIVKQLKQPVVLAGGLRPENVEQALRQVQPFGVDVSSGLESSPGIKDSTKIAAFMEGVKGV